jgi:flagellar hook-associated protein 2
MSDISIPGVPGASKFNTDQMVEDLMKVERIGLDRMESELDTYSTEKAAWQTVNRTLARVRDSSRSLYGFENPFNERVSVSSDESILTATASRDAAPENAEIIVERLAGRDRFLSRPLDEDFQAPAGTYTFGVGEKEVSFTYRGGDLRDLSEAINKRSKDLISSRLVRNSTSTQVLLIESQKAGAANTLTFSDQALSFAAQSGILKPSDSTTRIFSMDGLAFKRLDRPLTDGAVLFESGKAIFAPAGEALLPVSPAVVPKENLKLEIKYEVDVIPYDYVPPTRPAGPSIPNASSILYEGIEVRNEPSRVVEPDWNPPSPPVKHDNMHVFAVRGDGATYTLPPITDAGGQQTIEIEIGDYLDVIEAIEIQNGNTHRRISINSVRIFDPESRGGFMPLNPVETASDATMVLEGIEITRDTNVIDDLLPGVVLNLKKASEDPVQLTVEPDTEAVKDAIIEFVGFYDELVTELNILTGRSPEVVEEITYLTDEERQKAYDRLGLLQGDITIMQLKSRLQTMLMNPYETSLGRELSLLDQIGISTNAIGSRSGAVNRSRLRGYLEINEEVLDQALETKLSAIKELFGKDTDTDLVVDSGVAYTLDSYLRPYVETGGLIASRLGTIDGRVTRTTTKIETEQEKLAQKEQDYRRQFATMEGALNSLEQSSQQIDNFSRNNSSQ